MSELKESFLADVVRGDYLPNAVGIPLPFLQTCLEDNDTKSILPEDWRLAKFEELYGSDGRKSWLLIKWVETNLPQQLKEATEMLQEGSKVDYLKIVRSIPELRQCLEYADYLRELFQLQIDGIHNRLSSEKFTLLAKKAGELVSNFNNSRDKTRFDPEQDPKYQKQKEAAEAPQEPPIDRK